MEAHDTSGKAYIEALTKTLLILFRVEKIRSKKLCERRQNLRYPCCCEGPKPILPNKVSVRNLYCFYHLISYHKCHTLLKISINNYVCVFDLLQDFCEPIWQACVLLS